jgi:hypothetical protein
MTFGVNAPNGLVPVNTGNGNTWNGQTTSYPITATYGTALFTGDPVTLGTAGTIIAAVASQSILGVFVGCEYVVTTNKYTVNFPYWPGNPGVVSGTQPVARVIDDPRVRFSVQESSSAGASGTPLTQAAVGNNANIILSTGNTNSGQSRAFLDNGSSATTLLGMVKIVQLDPGITLGVASTAGTSGGVQTIGTAFQNWVVELNNDVYKAGSTRP